MNEKQVEIIPEIYDSLILVHSKNGNVDQALNTFNIMREKNMEGICSESYCDIIRLCLESDKHNLALRYLGEMQLSGHEVIIFFFLFIFRDVLFI